MSEIPAFPKFLKTLCANGRMLDEIVQVSKEVNVNAFMIGNLPPKLDDPGSFSIPITVGNISIDRALCDLGASVSLMPYSMYKRLRNVNELTPTRMTLQLADLPCHFVIMDIIEDVKTPIILGRPCLTTASTLINVDRCKLVMSVGEEKVEFAIRDVSSALVPNESIYLIDISECTSRI
ncbi:uncharacterized protein LOC130801022 [Amaranthus tricolor]|uniref:uncharacterized protein LOC130801020 n=1 Tax=Amaranthus tricolor TaxID=29722 RepID=UPI0025877609|nr:uncharacterized protein LOC130801020 [Amaranthus tricolor]XP_057520760.1 uncharacterized protein LOC130801022 [Amaranthus tricolor]